MSSDSNDTKNGWSRWEELVLQHIDDQKEHNESVTHTLHSIDTRLAVMESAAQKSGGTAGGITGFVVSVIAGIITYFMGGAK